MIACRPDFVERDLLRAVPRRAGDRDRGDHRVRDTPPPIRSACMPPIDPPETASSRGMPSESISIFCSRTMSPIVITGNDIAYGQPVAGLIDAGPGGAAAAAQHVGADDEVAVGVEALAGADHVVPPAGLAASWLMPAACASPENACSTRMAFDFAAFNSP